MLTSLALHALHSRLTLIFPHYAAGLGNKLPPPPKKMNLGSDAQGATRDYDGRKAMIGRVATQFTASLTVQGKLGAATKTGTIHHQQD